jgi:HEAT repeat protein
LIELLGSIGGARALQAVSDAAEDSDEAIQDAATQALGKWGDADAAPALLKLSKTLQSEKLRVRTLRGYMRIVQQMSLSAEQKLAMCDEAFRAAERDEERRLILNVLSHVPSAKSLAMVTPHLANSALRNEAALAAVAIGQKIVQAEPGLVAEAMQQVLKSGVSGETAARAQSLGKLGGGNPPSP